MLYLDNEFAELRYVPENSIVYHTFKQPVAGETLYEVVNKGVEVLKEHSASKWLSDDRHNGPLLEDDLKWAIEDWLPRARDAGWRYWALVVPDAMLARAHMIDFVKAFAEEGVQIMVFEEPEEGIKWLNTLSPN